MPRYYSLTHSPSHSLTHLLTYSPNLLTHSPTHSLTYSLTYLLTSNYAHVESIPGSNEAIFAALTFNGSNLLLHVKLGLQRGGVDITIKGVNKDVISIELTHITTVFA